MFKDIKGQEHAVELFRNSVNKDRLAGAYLFSGPQGVGKTLLAHNLTKFLNCENPAKEKTAFIDCCDSCSSCRKIDGFNHPDVHWIRAQKKSKRISIDEIRLAQKDISLKAYEGKFKVFIIEHAETLTAEAGNCLLKSLEEPPALCVLILISANISSLLPTIVSRCQIIKFYPLNYERLKEILTVNYRLPSDYSHFLSVASEGRLGTALSLKEQDVQKKKNYVIEHVCQFERGSSASQIFNIRDRQESVNQMSYLLNWFRDILIFKVGLASSFIINADRMQGVRRSASAYSFEDLEKILSKIIEAHRLIEQNVNPKIALEVMLLEIEKCKGSNARGSFS